MSLMDKLGLPVWRRCPRGHWHRVSSKDNACGHTGQVMEWCEPYQRWVVNPTKTAYALQMFEEDSEFDIEKEAKLKITEALKNGDLQPAIDYRRVIMNK